MSDETTFSRGPARRPAPVVVDPVIQWASGLPTVDRRFYAGWLIEYNRYADLDIAMTATEFETITIKHGSGNRVTYWAIPLGRFFVICDGVQTIAEMKHTPDRLGIAFGWRTTAEGRPQSQLRARVFLRELLEVGYFEPLTLTIKSTQTGNLINALMRQYTVLKYVDHTRHAKGLPMIAPPFYAASIPLGPGVEVARGTTQTKEITPPAAQVPDQLDPDYIKANWIRPSWVSTIESLVEPTIRWSVHTSKLIGQGVDEQPPADY